MHWPSKANVSTARLSFILKRFSSHLCIGQNGFHVRIKFSMNNLTLELSLFLKLQITEERMFMYS